MRASLLASAIARTLRSARFSPKVFALNRSIDPEAIERVECLEKMTNRPCVSLAASAIPGATARVVRKGVYDLVGLGPLDDLVKYIDGIAQLVGALGRLRIGLDSDHQILVGNPDIDRPIAETFALIEPLRAERP